jgi:hypothetical protein
MLARAKAPRGPSLGPQAAASAISAVASSIAAMLDDPSGIHSPQLMFYIER